MKVPEGWKRVLIPVQHMFPNCNIRYKTKCADMKSCDKDDQFARIHVEPDIKDLKKAKTKPTKPPKGFEPDIKSYDDVWDGK